MLISFNLPECLFNNRNNEKRQIICKNYVRYRRTYAGSRDMGNKA